MRIVTILLAILPIVGISQIPFLQLSPKQIVTQRAGVTDITIEYSRPSIRNRVIFGGLVPYGKKWRTGANRNTKITFSEDIIIGKDTITSGDYTLYTRPYRDSWDLYIYDETDQLDVPLQWEDSKLLGSISAPSFRTARTYESMMIAIENITNNTFEICIYWENTGVAFPVSLTTEESMLQDIQMTLSGPSHNDYFNAALYRQRSGVDPISALEWIDKCILLRLDEYFWDHLIRAKALKGLGRKIDALAAAEKSLILAKKRKSNSGIKEANDFINAYED